MNAIHDEACSKKNRDDIKKIEDDCGLRESLATIGEIRLTFLLKRSELKTA